MIDQNQQHDYRCQKCGRLFFRAVLTPPYSINVKCGKCDTWNLFADRNIIVTVDIHTIEEITCQTSQA